MQRAALVSTLEFVSRALAENDLVPVMQCFCFTGKEVVAYNDTLAIIAPCETPGAFALNGKLLVKLLNASQGEEVTFTLGEKHEVTVKAGRSVFKLPYHPADKLFVFVEPVVKASPISQPWSEARAKAVAAAFTTSSKDLTQEGLMGLCVNQGNLYGCDSDALTRCEGWLGGMSTFGPATMPNAFCEALLKAPQVYDDKQRLIITNEWAKAQIGNYRIYGRMLASTPLDHEQLIKDTVKGKLTYVALPDGLEHALSRAMVVAEAESAKTVLTVEAGKLRLLTTTHMGVVKDNLPLPKHPDVRADVSAANLQRSISLCKEMAITENCVCLRGDGLFILTSNIGV
jgi:DNA polymerase III sliding clamp (beta) subunit (PCNA family)